MGSLLLVYVCVKVVGGLTSSSKPAPTHIPQAKFPEPKRDIAAEKAEFIKLFMEAEAAKDAKHSVSH